MNGGDRVGHEMRLRAAVLAGDERAWRAWYDEASAGLRAYVHWRCAGMRDLADEVVQETWLVAVRRVRDFHPEAGPFAGWLCGIAANLLRNHLRGRQRHSGRVFALANNHPVPDPATITQDGHEQSERIARALAELAPHYERVLRAKYLDDQSVQAIASAWGESPKAIESLLTRARQAFREAYLRTGLTDG
jgi:RNA polymerase sigma-70 factor (ECF subfamily)